MNGMFGTEQNNGLAAIIMAPFQGFGSYGIHITQGVALGCTIMPSQGFKALRLFTSLNSGGYKE